MKNYVSDLMNPMLNNLFASKERLISAMMIAVTMIAAMIVVMIVVRCGALIFHAVFGAKWIGSHGEKLIEKKLKRLIGSGVDGVVLRNVYIPKSRGETSEIDVLFLTRKGIFVIESKNYSGWIYGDENGSRWTATLPNGTRNQFYNPIRQNQTHIKWLKKLLSTEIPVYSLIVFSDRCKLKKVSVYSEDVVVIQRKRIIKEVRARLKKSGFLLSEGQMQRLAEQLKPYTKVSKFAKFAHIHQIKKRYQKK